MKIPGPIASDLGRNPPWLFGVACLVLNGAGFIAATPFLLRRAGIAVPEIAALTALLSIPNFCFFLWTPIVEIGLSRRHWFMVLNVAYALFETLALLQPLPSNLRWFIVLVFIGDLAGFAQIGIFGPLVRDTVPEPIRGQVAGWMQAGQFVSLAGSGLIIWIAEHYSRMALAMSVGAMGMIPIAAMWRIHEPPRSQSMSLREQFQAIGRDLRSGFQLRSVREGLVIFTSPMSAATLVYLFSGIAVDYHVSARTTAFVSAAGGSIAGSIGAICGGRFVGRIGATLSYPLAGIAVGLCGSAMMLGPFSPATYAMGSMIYIGMAGCCGAASIALMVELTAGAGHSSSTWFATLWAATNLPQGYMAWLDGQGYKHFGPRGMLAVDILGNALPAVLFLAYLRNARAAQDKAITA
jgi:hypothetical protein